jgi:hypothetical protein
MRHDLVVSFQKVSLGFTKPNLSCREFVSPNFLSLAHKSFSTPLQLFYMK